LKYGLNASSKGGLGLLFFLVFSELGLERAPLIPIKSEKKTTTESEM